MKGYYCTDYLITYLLRLQFIIDRCPVLRRDATIALVRMLKEKTMDVGRYNALMSNLELLDSDASCTVGFNTLLS